MLAHKNLPSLSISVPQKENKSSDIAPAVAPGLLLRRTGRVTNQQQSNGSPVAMPPNLTPPSSAVSGSASVITSYTNYCNNNGNNDQVENMNGRDLMDIDDDLSGRNDVDAMQIDDDVIDHNISDRMQIC